jgi:hypothetical protein
LSDQLLLGSLGVCVLPSVFLTLLSLLLSRDLTFLSCRLFRHEFGLVLLNYGHQLRKDIAP